MKFSSEELSQAAREELQSTQDNVFVAVNALSESQLRALVLQLSHYQLAQELLGNEGKIPDEEEIKALDAMGKLQETVMGVLQLTDEQGDFNE